MQQPSPPRFPELASLESIESCFARVHRGPDTVFKRPAPIRLRLDEGWLDLSSVPARRQACLAEQAFHRRTGSELAIGVVALRRGPDGGEGFGERGEIVDWALQLHRLPDTDRVDRRLDQDRLTDESLAAVAGHLAWLHRRAPRLPPPAADAVFARLDARIRLRIEAPEWPRSTPLPPELADLEAWQIERLEQLAERLARRVPDHILPEGHGELGLEHVFVSDDGRVQLLAGLEGASGRLDVDTIWDLALLANGLALRRRVDLAERLVAEYARSAQDFDLYPLLDFYESLAAARSGKLAWLCADRLQPGSSRADRARRGARALFALARAAPRRPLLPAAVVAMGGQVASGKSTLARLVARQIAAPIVSSDRTRDHLLQSALAEEAAPGSDADPIPDVHEAQWIQTYEPDFGDRVYDEVLRRAGEVLVSGRPVVIDGCFHSRSRREAAHRLAERFGRPFLFVEVATTPEVQIERLRARAARDGVELDDWRQIAEGLRADWEPVDELRERETLRLDGAAAPERSAGAIEARLPTWPPELSG